MDNFCLKWNDFGGNIRESLKKLRSDEALADVTLATEDGRHIKAHKIILSAGSQFFQDIFVKSNHVNMLVYLKGISFADLEPVINFLYNGEAFVAQEEVEKFVKTGKELKVKGLSSELKGTGGHTQAQSSFANNYNPIKEEPEYTDEPESQSSFANNYNPIKEEPEYTDEPEYSEYSGEPENSDTGTRDMSESQGQDSQLQFKTVEEIIEKIEIEGVWSCKVCGKTTRGKTNMKRHAEIHIEGVSHVCQDCRMIFHTSNALRTHRYHKH